MNQNLAKLNSIMGELDDSQLKLEKHAFDVINSSDTSLNFVKDGITNIKDIIDEIESMNKVIQESSENIKKLEDLSVLIENFANVISKIAAKTNMLSLNASIEAARAGEQGRGFAVVAQQVGELASQSTKSSKDISDTVKEVHSFVDEMVASMNDILESSVRTNEKASDTSKLLQSILDAALIANNESRGIEHEIAFQRDITDNAKEALQAMEE